jgi:hypothetical protein
MAQAENNNIDMIPAVKMIFFMAISPLFGDVQISYTLFDQFLPGFFLRLKRMDQKKGKRALPCPLPLP